jgi:hypothetical protein
LAMIIIIKTVSIIPRWHDRFGTIIHCRSFYSLDIVFKTVVGPFYRKYSLLIVFLLVFRLTLYHHTYVINVVS